MQDAIAQLVHEKSAEILREVGFCEVRPWDPRDCRYHDFKDKAGKVMRVGGQSFEISLNLEAVK